MCSWIRRINIIKIPILPKAIYRFSAIPIKIPMMIPRTRTNISKVYMEPKQAPHSNRDPEKEQRWRSYANIKLYYKAIVIKTAWYWHKIDT